MLVGSIRICAPSLLIPSAARMEYLAAGLIKRSASLFSSTLVVIPRKGGGAHITINYRKLSKVNIFGQLQVSRVDEVLGPLDMGPVLSTFDVTSSFYQSPCTNISYRWPPLERHLSCMNGLLCLRGMMRLVVRQSHQRGDKTAGYLAHYELKSSVWTTFRKVVYLVSSTFDSKLSSYCGSRLLAYVLRKSSVELALWVTSVGPRLCSRLTC